MTSKPHIKHGKTLRPKGGKIHSNEISFLGAPCSRILELSEQIALELAPKLTCAYVDASHDEIARKHPFHIHYLNHQNYGTLEWTENGNDMRMRGTLNHADIALVNGNHNTASKQVVIINSKKRESLSKKLDRLTDVVLIVLDGEDSVYDFIGELNLNVPILKSTDIPKITEVIVSTLGVHSSELMGLVLAGGKSTRMGKDKGALEFHGKAQREHAADLLSSFTAKTFVSVRDINPGFESAYDFLPDSFLDLGPFGGILTAMRSQPNAAWLSVATDIPRLNSEMLSELVRRRNPSKVATCFYNPETKFPEPLITIWEPRAYHVMLEFLANGYSCPRKVLINSDVEMIDNPVYYDNLINVNTPEELEALVVK